MVFNISKKQLLIALHADLRLNVSVKMGTAERFDYCENRRLTHIAVRVMTAEELIKSVTFNHLPTHHLPLEEFTFLIYELRFSQFYSFRLFLSTIKHPDPWDISRVNKDFFLVVSVVNILIIQYEND